ncbi:hypothetical protein [Pandoraea communis]|uniref:hypothetical protein n=1 Tax=Pandoraea communis TaxID=2508297 RepID=UPI00123F1897|nr:hypothetical protein [Pandoraea communis]
MITLPTYLVDQASRTEDLLVKIAGRNEKILGLYRSQLKSIFHDIKSGELQAPSDVLSGYWYYFSPEGPWHIWETFPDLVSSISTVINLLGLCDEQEFYAYCRRHKINVD